MKQFLPISRADMKAQGIKQLDFVYVIGDAYVDHPSFGHAIISRILEANGFTVGIISQPDWKDHGQYQYSGRTKTWISCNRWKYGFHGKPLFCFQKTPAERCFHARRRHGKTPGLRHCRVL